MLSQVKYHVTFFKDNLQCAWINLKNIKTFKKYKKCTLIKKVSYYKYIYIYLKHIYK